MTNDTEQTYGKQIDSRQALKNCGDKLDKLTALAEEWIGAPEVIDQINQIAWGIKSDALEAGEAIGLRNAQKQEADKQKQEVNKRNYVAVYDALCHAESAAEKSALCTWSFYEQIFQDPLIDDNNIGYHAERLRPFVEIAFDCTADSRKECHEVLKAVRS